ncbi:MAG: lamin tail domain-containing protein, partial [Anaerolineae bacterium]
MKRTLWLIAACLLGGLMPIMVWAGLSPPAGASPALDPPPVVINEVGWSGTAADYRDEWIELHNTTPATVALSGWHLVDDDNLDITLMGAIPPHGYTLIERGDDDTVADVPAGWTGSFGYGLSDSGEVLTLTNALGNVVDTANAENGGAWPAGTNNPDHSMERLDPAAPDTDANWATNDGFIRNGRDANSAPLNATPLCRNSAASPAADLVIQKHGPTLAQPGARLTYTVGLRNAGNHMASGVLVTDTLPAGLALSAQQAPFTFDQPTSDTLVWAVGQLPVSTTYALITIAVEVSPTLTGDLTNVVTAATTLTEAAPANNTAARTTRVLTPAPALGLAKSGPPFITPGLPLTCHIALSNTGNLPATGVVVTDTLPPGMAFITHTSPLTFVHVASDTLVWHVGSLPTDTVQAITLTLRTVSELTGTVTNTVTASTRSGRVATATWNAPAVPYVRLYALEPVNHGGSGEVAALINLAPHPVQLGDWSLNDDPVPGGATFPTTATIGAEEILWLAQDGDGFRQVWGFDAHWAATAITRPVPTLNGGWPGFTDGGEATYLLDDEGRLIDALVYGESAATAGWHGPVLPYPYAGYSRGQVLYRKLDQATGKPVPDTDAAADWSQDPDDPVDGRRLRYPGWDLETFFFPPVVTPTAPITMAVAPDGAFELVSRTLATAQESVLLEGYTFKSAALYNVLSERLDAGVVVTVLLEGGTAFGVDEEELWGAAEIDQHPNGSVYFLHGSPVRYAFQHAKFAVIDGQIALLGTENFGPGGMPSDRKDNGTMGHRGVVVAVRSPGVVAHLESIFAHDLDPAHHADLVPYGVEPFVLEDPLFEPVPEPDWTSYTASFSPTLATTGTHFTLLQAPENALREQDGLLGLLGRTGRGDRIAAIQADER